MSKKIDMVGWKMWEHGVPDSRLTVLKEVDPYISPKGHHEPRFLCECSCFDKDGKHPQVIVKGRNLRTGNTKSCGCLAKEKLVARNISKGKQIQIGDRFGKLVVIKDLGMRKQLSRDKNWRWSLCQCDCGSAPIEVPNNHLLTGSIKSCGCLYSYGEHLIETILQENNINYIKEYKFPDLLSDKNKPYRFDFAIFQDNKLSFLIEFDGRQHYSGPEGNWTQSRTLEEEQRIDRIKNEYCKNHNILLKRIPYFAISKINLETIFSNKFNI